MCQSRSNQTIPWSSILLTTDANVDLNFCVSGLYNMYEIIVVPGTTKSYSLSSLWSYYGVQLLTTDMSTVYEAILYFLFV